MDPADINAFLKDLSQRLKVQKVVGSRTLKVNGGDYFASFAAVWNDGEEVAVDDSGMPVPNGLMSLREARVAHLLIAMHADIAAHDQALAGGSISEQFYRDAVSAIKSRFARRISRIMGASTPGKEGTNE